MYDHDPLTAMKQEDKKRQRDTLNPDDRMLAQVSDADIFFAKQRLFLHESTPEEGVSLEVLKKYIQKKYGI